MFVMRYEVVHCSNKTMYRGNRVWFGDDYQGWL